MSASTIRVTAPKFESHPPRRLRVDRDWYQRHRDDMAKWPSGPRRMLLIFAALSTKKRAILVDAMKAAKMARFAKALTAAVRS